MENFPNLNLKKADFTLTFESHGTPFLFEDMVANYYMSQEFIKIYQNGAVQIYEPNRVLVEMNSIGESHTVADTKQMIESLSSLLKSCAAEIPGLSAKTKFSKDDVAHMFSVMGLIMKQYEYFDMNFWDSTYKKSSTDAVATENIKLVGEYKNVLREELNPIYFDNNGYYSFLLQNLSQQFDINVAELSWYKEEEIYKLFSGQKVSSEKQEQRKQGYAYVRINSDEIIFHTGDTAKEIINIFKDNTDIIPTVIKGTVAHGKGRKMTGKVRLIKRDYNSPEVTRESMAKMEQGEILVAQTTDPDLSEAMKKAAAIITDIGGLLSHSAITARELDTICIIGTANASKLLKNGDMVEVDATIGTIKLI